ncbi:hypothetical protein WR25_13750 [Diploscapter pachys]|uniref:Uncharacterized protein n=1 Tax=Diploscapter pachys TaxID=2018661 RepID=A0A2A2K457_9BILA|nr:hypothetical protein WR25_13750 [Diploscapter pachys]
MFGAMAERRLGQPAAQHLHRRLMRDLAECDDDAQVGKRCDLGVEILAAGADFLRRRLVGGRQALHRVEDDRAGEGDIVGRAVGESAGGEANLHQRREQQRSRMVAGEGAAGAVGAVQTGRKADNRDRRVRIAEGGHRGVPPRRVLFAQCLARRDEAGAERAIPRRLHGKKGRGWGGV